MSVIGAAIAFSLASVTYGTEAIASPRGNSDPASQVTTGHHDSVAIVRSVHGEITVTAARKSGFGPEATFSCTVDRDGHFSDGSGGFNLFGKWYFSASGRCTVVMGAISYFAGVYRDDGTAEDHISGDAPSVNVAGDSGDLSCAIGTSTPCIGAWTYHYQVYLLAPPNYGWNTWSSECTVDGGEPRLLKCQAEWNFTL
ncbi:hypothetical protein ILP97_00320 [Amycolatopsis sp. H6(2020)]|nr:hypothetical protein [Amycolatopsis sp. H6(2020)]